MSKVARNAVIFVLLAALSVATGRLAIVASEIVPVAIDGSPAQEKAVLTCNQPFPPLPIPSIPQGKVPPRSSVTLCPGTYRLTWQFGDSSSTQRFSDAKFRRLQAAEAAKYKGLKSVRCLSTTFGSIRAILDESLGTGKGYDTAYLLPTYPTVGQVDLATDSVRLPLKRLEDVLESDGSRATVAGLQRRCCAQITVCCAGELRKRDFRPKGWIDLTYGMTGTVKTNTGSVEISVADHDCNGRYNDPIRRAPKSGGIVDGDSILIERDIPLSIGSTSQPDGPSGFTVDIAETGQGKAVAYGGKLYDICVSPAGDSITVLPYAGATGKLTVQVVDAEYRQSSWESLRLIGDAGDYEFAAEDDDIRVPPGNYDWHLTIKPPSEPNGRDHSNLEFRVRGRVEVVEGQSAIIAAGGPLSLGIEPEKHVIEARRGQRVTMQLSLRLAKGGTTKFSSYTFPAVNVVDASGKQVADCYTDHENRSTFTVSQTWKPGRYAIIAVLDPRPYQKTIRTSKALIVK